MNKLKEKMKMKNKLKFKKSMYIASTLLVAFYANKLLADDDTKTYTAYRIQYAPFAKAYMTVPMEKKISATECEKVIKDEIAESDKETIKIVDKETKKCHTINENTIDCVSETDITHYYCIPSELDSEKTFPEEVSIFIDTVDDPKNEKRNNMFPFG
jgi:hypothetical protein